jgi:hypothetical protein
MKNLLEAAPQKVHTVLKSNGIALKIASVFDRAKRENPEN